MMEVERTIEDAMVTRLAARAYIVANSIPVRRYDDRATLDGGITAIVRCEPVMRVQPNYDRYMTMIQLVALNNGEDDVEADNLQALDDDLFDEIMTDMTVASLNASITDPLITIDGIVHEQGAYDGGDKYKMLGNQAMLYLTFTVADYLIDDDGNFLVDDDDNYLIAV